MFFFLLVYFTFLPTVPMDTISTNLIQVINNHGSKKVPQFFFWGAMRKNTDEELA
tara:strand:+ start:166 stop:330 length:165 start_codon:yes stop_codon:yes gene_type:complete